jgi:hypothetical protein
MSDCQKANKDSVGVPGWDQIVGYGINVKDYVLMVEMID